jgi:hypothetical protein
LESHISIYLSIYPSIHLSIYGSLLDLGRFFSFLIFDTVGRTPWTGDQPVARSLPAHRSAQTQNKCTQTSMPQVGFEPTIPVIERAKTIHDRPRGHCDRFFNYSIPKNVLPHFFHSSISSVNSINPHHPTRHADVKLTMLSVQVMQLCLKPLGRSQCKNRARHKGPASPTVVTSRRRRQKDKLSTAIQFKIPASSSLDSPHWD